MGGECSVIGAKGDDGGCSITVSTFSFAENVSIQNFTTDFVRSMRKKEKH